MTKITQNTGKEMELKCSKVFYWLGSGESAD